MTQNGNQPQLPFGGMGVHAPTTFSLRLRPGLSGASSSSNDNRTANQEASPDLASKGPLSEAEYERLVHSQQYGWMLD